MAPQYPNAQYHQAGGQYPQYQPQPMIMQQQPQQPQPSQQQSKRPARRCAEVCLELLAIESVRMFSEKQTGPTAAASLEAVGVRVGRQLAER